MLRKLIIVVMSFLIYGCTHQSTEDLSSGIRHNADYKKASMLNVELGLNYLQRNDIVRAKNKILNALKLDPKNPKAHIAMGLYWQYVKESKEAEKYLINAVNYSDYGAEESHQLALFLYRQGEYDKAQEIFKKALEDKTYLQLDVAYQDAAICSIASNDKALAYKYFSKSLDHNATLYSSLLYLAALSFEDDNLSAAKSYLVRYSQRAPLNARFYLLKAKIALKERNYFTYNQAATVLRKNFIDSSEYKELVRMESNQSEQ